MAEGWIQGKPCRVTIDTGASVTFARPDMVGQPERKPSKAYVLQMTFGETIPVLKMALVKLTLERRALRIWVFVAEVTKENIVGLDVLRSYDAIWRGKSPMPQTCWEGPYTITRINICTGFRGIPGRMMVVHLDRLSPYLGSTREE